MKVVLDTNVLVNMLNKDSIQGDYITRMVSKIITDHRVLCLDSGKRIDKEYFKILGQAMLNKEREKEPTESTVRQILGFFVNLNGVPYEHTERNKVDKTDLLMKCIGKQIPIEEDMDRVMVYVAAKSGATLVTDDYDHILSDDGRREASLKKCADRFGDTSFDLMDTHSAKATLDSIS